MNALKTVSDTLPFSSRIAKREDEEALRRNADAKRRNVGAKRGGIGSLVNAYGGVPGLLEYFAFYCI